jgi:hypothetical protein
LDSGPIRKAVHIIGACPQHKAFVALPDERTRAEAEYAKAALREIGRVLLAVAVDRAHSW